MFVPLSVISSAFIIAWGITWLLIRPGAHLQILDVPNARSLHSMPIPRSGGLAIWAGFVVGAILVVGVLDTLEQLPWIGTAALLVAVVSFIDDRFQVRARLRLAVHFMAAALLLLGGLGLSAVRLPGTVLELPAFLAAVATILFVVWMINLYNFMDGMDGFAGGMALFGFGALGLLGWLGGDAAYAALCWAIAAAAAGFLVWNFPPARVFMGDTGSSVLGLMAASLSLLGDRLGLFPLWIALLVFSPFIVDATVTLIRRAGRRERLWEAHRSHYYQRLVQLGWGHRKTVLAEYVLMGGCAATAVGLLYASSGMQWLGVTAWGLVYAGVMSAIDFHFRRIGNSSKHENDDLV